MRAFFIALTFCVGVFLVYQFSKPKEKSLKIYNPVDVSAQMMDSDLVGKGIGHTIQKFSFTDQMNQAFGSKELEGKVYVVEYFFTTCGTICPMMNAQMQRVQQAFKGEKSFHIVSFTVDPDVDTVAQLKRYAESHLADDKQWHFLTGKKEDLYRLARRSFFVLKPAEAANQGDVGLDFIHTNNFVLIDRKKRIRGYYDGTNTNEVDKLIVDIQKLLEEQ